MNSNDNAYSEALFRTTKYRHDFPRDGFKTVEDARVWVLGFDRWYNTEHRHSAIKFVTPTQRHEANDVEILINREQLCKQKNLTQTVGVVRHEMYSLRRYVRASLRKARESPLNMFNLACTASKSIGTNASRVIS